MKRKLLSLITLAAMAAALVPAIPAAAAANLNAEVSQAYAADSNNDGGATGFVATFTGRTDVWYSLYSMTWNVTPSDGSGAKTFTYGSSNGMPTISLNNGATAYVGLIIEGLNDSGATATASARATMDVL